MWGVQFVQRSSLVRDPILFSCPFLQVRTQLEDGGLSFWKLALTGHQICWHSDLRLPASVSESDTFLSISHLSLWHCVLAAPTGEERLKQSEVRLCPQGAVSSVAAGIRNTAKRTEGGGPAGATQ